MNQSSPVSLRLAVLLASILCAWPAAAEPSKYTANFLRGNSAAELGKKVNVDVSWVQAVRRVEVDDFAVFAVHTWDERENLPGGIIAAVVAKSQAQGFANKFGTSPDVEKRRGRGGVDLETGRLGGVLSEAGGKVLYLDLTDGAAAKAGLKVPGEALGAAPVRERLKDKFRAKG